MSNLIHTQLFTMVLLCILCAVSKADDASFEAGVSSHVQFFQYQEFNTNGQSLNKEEGLLPGLHFFGRFSHKRFHHQLIGEIFGGEVDYDGLTQLGAPHKTTTKTHLYRLAYRFEADLVDTKAHPKQLAAFFSASWNYWSRSIQPSGIIIGLEESYRWPSLGIGLKLPLIVSGKHSVMLSSAYLHILKGKFTVDLSAIGFNEPELELGSGEGFESYLNYTFKLPDTSKAGIDLYYRQWSFAESQPMTLNNGSRSISFLEPRSKSKRLGMAFTFTVPF